MKYKKLWIFEKYFEGILFKILFFKEYFEVLTNIHFIFVRKCRRKLQILSRIFEGPKKEKHLKFEEYFEGRPDQKSRIFHEFIKKILKDELTRYGGFF